MDIILSTFHQISEANCAFSVHLVTSVNINQNPVKFETVDLNICIGYNAATGKKLSAINLIVCDGYNPGVGSLALCRFKFTEKYKESLIVIQMVQTLHASANILHVC